MALALKIPVSDATPTIAPVKSSLRMLISCCAVKNKLAFAS
jgi:hypothetical protein